MIILTIRTDKPESEIGLYKDNRRLTYCTWQAHRQLAETIHLKLKDLLDSQNFSWQDVEAIAVYQGPGSFTGLRIGLSVANTLADSLQVPIVSAKGDNWIPEAIGRLLNGDNEKIALPDYGAPPKTTRQKK